MSSVVDTNRNVTGLVSCLRQQGVRGVIRYYSRAQSSKVIRQREFDAILAAGLDLCIVHQRGGRDPAEFTGETGRLDAAHCLDYGHALGQPGGSAIYFAVDFDILKPAIDQHLLPYFTAVRETMAAAEARAYRVGVYGSGMTCRRLLEAGLVELTWLSQSRAFQGTAEFRASNRWNLLQLLNEPLCGIQVDPDIVEPGKPDYGQFAAGGAIGHLAVPAIPAVTARRMRVMARGGLRLRAGPGPEFDRLGLLPFGQVVTAEREQGAWTMVDLQGDGKLDGAVFTAFLEHA